LKEEPKHAAISTVAPSTPPNHLVGCVACEDVCWHFASWIGCRATKGT
jgi:hypothetical protein